MRKMNLLFTMISFLSLLACDSSYAFNRSGPVNRNDLMKVNSGSEFVKLDFKAFAKLTGREKNLANRVSFNLLKIKVRHELKKDPHYKLSSDFESGKKTSPFFKVLYWVLLVFLVLLVIMGLVLSKGKS